MGVMKRTFPFSLPFHVAISSGVSIVANTASPDTTPFVLHDHAGGRPMTGKLPPGVVAIM
jgi:hypothetical protein